MLQRTTSAPDFSQVQRYARDQAGTVMGYLRTLDLHVLSTLGERQSEMELTAGMLEIGVHHGKLFFLLAALRQKTERALAIDLFTDDLGNASRAHRGRDTAFHLNATKLDIMLEGDEILRRDSRLTTAEEIIARIGPARIISIDGGHDLETVASDLALCEDVLHPAGFIALDDFNHAQYPGVRDATLSFLETRRETFAPFLMTPAKLYICHRPEIGRYREMLQDRRLSGALKTSCGILGEEVLTMRWPRAEAARRLFGQMFFAVVERARRRVKQRNSCTSTRSPAIPT